jgi:membrane carboxypeptidase/penicillin-binding protein
MHNPLIILAKFLYPKDYALLELKLNQVSPVILISSKQTDILKKLLISGEDHRFIYHLGFDLIAIIRAIRNRIFYKRIEGASTIEQQLVRVITSDFNKSLRRKIKEIILATTLRYIIPRKSIPLIYLQLAYYGTNMIGLNAVLSKLKIQSNDYLTEEIAAEIIARIKYPEPKLLTPTRAKQILARKQHLLNLYNNHRNRKIIKVYA